MSLGNQLAVKRTGRLASWAMGPTCRATACRPARWRASGRTAKAGPRSRKRPCLAWTRTWRPCPSKPPAMRWPGPGFAPSGLRAVWVGSGIAPLRGQADFDHRGGSHRRCPRTSRRRIGSLPARPARKPSWPPWRMVGSGMAQYAMAIGMDTAQGKPGDSLEYTAGAGGAAFILGPGEEAAGDDRIFLLVCDRYARFLAARRAKISRARAALYRRPGLFQAHHHRRANLLDLTARPCRPITSLRSSTNPTPSSRSGRPPSWASSPSRSAPGCWCR